MSTIKISESGTVQFPMVNHAAELGWEPLRPAEALNRRGDETRAFFGDLLAAKLAEFNPWLTADSVRAIVETLDSVPPTIEGNRELLAWMRGEHTWYDESEKRQRQVRVIEYDVALLPDPIRPDLVVADPPYGLAFVSNRSKRGPQSIIGDDGDLDDVAWLSLWRPEIGAYVWCHWQRITPIIDALRTVGMDPKHRIVWNKGHWGSGNLAQYGSQTEDCVCWLRSDYKIPWGEARGQCVARRVASRTRRTSYAEAT